MKLYLISQDENSGYDTFDSAVVCAESEEQAKTMYPSGGFMGSEDWPYGWVDSPEFVTAEYIGEAKEGMEVGVVVASYNAG